MPLKNSQINGAHDAEKMSNMNTKTTSPIGAREEVQSNETISSKPEAKPNGKKRKVPPTTSQQHSAGSRRSARSAPSAPVDTVKALNYLISPASLALARPEDEMLNLETRNPKTRTYSSSEFTPFEELLCAVILSRPIGHMLGLRSIRTLFNEPYSLVTPKAIRTAGKDGCREALDAAKTQHRQKTAEELVILANAVADNIGSGENDTSLERVRKESGYDTEKERDLLKKSIKGLGKTGLDIFARRIQEAWPEFYPFADGRSMEAVERLGLGGSAEELKETIENKWGELEKTDLTAGDEKGQKRRAFVRVLERAVGAELEGNLDAVKAETA